MFLSACTYGGLPPADIRMELFKSSNFVPMGVPDKAAKALIGLFDDPEPVCFQLPGFGDDDHE
jgi:hypothetical protein